MLFYLLLSLSPPSLAEAVEGAEVTVEATGLGMGDDWGSAASVTVIPVNEQLGVQENVARLTARAPGVLLTQFGDSDAFAGVSIRGSTLRQVAVYLDGIPLNPDGNEATNLSEWPLRALKRIEVYRGNAPASLGGAAMGGTIHMVSTDKSTPFAGGLSGNSTQRAAFDAYTQLSPTWLGSNHTLTVFNETVGSKGQYRYFSDNGTPYNRMDDARLSRENNQTLSDSGLFRWRFKRDQTRIDVVDSWLIRDQGLPGHTNNPSLHARLGVKRNLLGASFRQSMNFQRLDGAAWLLQRGEEYDDRRNELGLEAQRTLRTTRNVGGRLHHSFVIFPWFGGGYLLGTQYDQPRKQSLLTGENAALPGRNVNTLGMDLSLAWSGFGITPVLHTTHIPKTNGDGAGLVSVDPRVGTRVQPTDWLVFRGNVGRFLRPPTMTEMYGDRGTMSGNPDLQPERGIQGDVGARVRTGKPESLHLSLDVAHFWNSSHDRITWVQNGQRTFKPMNLGRTWVQGIEAACRSALGTSLALESSVTWAQSTNLDPAPTVANKQLPGVPVWSGWSSMSWSPVAEMISFSYMYRFTGANYWDATNWHRSAPRSFHDAFLQTRPFEHPLQVEFGVQNLFDKLVQVVPQNPLSGPDGPKAVQPVTDFSGYPLPGRVWSVGLRWMGANK